MRLYLSFLAVCFVFNGISQPFNKLRYKEDYSFLEEQSKKGLEKLKWMPIGKIAILSVGGELREQYTRYNNPIVNANQASIGFNDWYLHRFMAHADLRIKQNWHFFAQLGNSLLLPNSKIARPEIDRNELYLHQAFALWRPLAQKNQSIAIKLGRSEVSLGSDRMITLRGSPNVRLSYNGAFIDISTLGVQSQIFWVKPIVSTPGFLNNTQSNVLTGWGAYQTLSFLKPSRIELYYIGFRKNHNTMPGTSDTEQRHSFGLRYALKRGGTQVAHEFIYQLGKREKQHIKAWQYSGSSIYTSALGERQATAMFKWNVVSGDTNPTDNQINTFYTLSAKPPMGDASPFGAINLVNLNPAVQMKFFGKLRATLAYYAMWRYSLHDGMYSKGLNLFLNHETDLPADNYFLGNQIGLNLSYLLNKNISFTIDPAYYIPSNLIKKGRNNKNMLYTMAQFHILF